MGRSDEFTSLIRNISAHAGQIGWVLPIQTDHPKFLTIKKMRWSICSGTASCGSKRECLKAFADLH